MAVSQDKVEGLIQILEELIKGLRKPTMDLRDAKFTIEEELEEVELKQGKLTTVGVGKIITLVLKVGTPKATNG